MQSLRIALGLLALVAVFFLAVPGAPTLLAGRPGAAAPSLAAADVVAQPAEGTADPAPDAGPTAAAPVRAIGPASVETTALTRLPPATSGAATPPKAVGTGPTEPEAAAPADEPPTEDETAIAAAPEPTGPDYRLFARPIAVDAGTLKAGAVTLLVAGVEPLDGEARCADGARASPCATRARTALRGWLRGRSVLCAVPAQATQASEITAPCLLGEEDVGDWVVRNGWARAAPGSRYEAAEKEARRARRGVWAYGAGEDALPRSGG